MDTVLQCPASVNQNSHWGEAHHAMSPHKFFKVFLLYFDYRPSVDRPSTERWPITDRYISEVSRTIGQVSAKSRRSVGEVSVNEKLYRPRHIWNDYRTCLDRVSTDYWPLYRPTDRSTLPTVNMMISQPLFTRLACLGLSLIPVKERERVSGKVSDINQRFLNSCLANSPSHLYIHS